MHSFVYGSRVIENEQQITLERRAKRIGNWIYYVVKALLALFLFVGLNALLSNLVQHTNLFSPNTYLTTVRFIEEATRVLFVDNAFSTSSIFYQELLAFVAALTFVGVAEYGFVVRALGNADEHSKEGHDSHDKREEKSQTVSNYGIFSYRQKVSFLS